MLKWQWKELMWMKKMIDMRKYVEKILKEFNIETSILDVYFEPNRFYHNWDHINAMIESAGNMIRPPENIQFKDLVLAIVFHDIIYDPKRTDNEERSADLFYSYVKNKHIKQAILDTKIHKPSNELSKILCELDIENLYGDFDNFIDISYKVFKEYQFVDWKTYSVERIKFLEKYNVDPIYIKAVKSFKPNIAIYAGSFNKFHKGHYNILEKAERIFDKVIIARGVNPDKDNKLHNLPDIICNRQIENYDGLLTDFIDSLGYNVTLIRGLRNITDLQFELKQYQYLKDFKPDINVVSIFCDKEFEHLSSSAIRMLEKYNKSNNYLI